MWSYVDIVGRACNWRRTKRSLSGNKEVSLLEEAITPPKHDTIAIHKLTAKYPSNMYPIYASTLVHVPDLVSYTARFSPPPHQGLKALTPGFGANFFAPTVMRTYSPRASSGPAHLSCRGDVASHSSAHSAAASRPRHPPPHHYRHPSPPSAPSSPANGCKIRDGNQSSSSAHDTVLRPVADKRGISHRRRAVSHASYGHGRRSPVGNR
ncbi:hypothetical protein VTI74DRAFT_476 [Chaetomium olivicolor]